MSGVKFFKAEDMRDWHGKTMAWQELHLLADELNKLMAERGTRVYGAPDNGWTPERMNHDRETYTALLIDVREIAPADTAEDVVCAVVSAFADGTSVEIRVRAIERAKRWLDPAC